MTSNKLNKIQDKMRKLRAMAETIGPEAENAKRIMAKLIEKYELEGMNADELLDEPKTYRIRAHRLKKYASSLAAFCKVPCYAYRGEPDFIGIKANSMEYRMYYELYQELKHIFNTKMRELKQEQRATGQSGRWMNGALQSFMLGYVAGNFPIVRDDTCRECKKGKVVNGICDHCGARYKQSRWQGYRRDEGQFQAGRNTNTKKLNQSKLQIGSR